MRGRVVRIEPSSHGPNRQPSSASCVLNSEAPASERSDPRLQGMELEVLSNHAV
jgi:hypothetical protein